MKLLTKFFFIVLFFNSNLLMAEDCSDCPVLKLNESQLEDFRNQSLNKIKELSRYISIIADKSKPEDLKRRSIDLAVKLFMTEKNVVQTSSTSSNKINNTPIRQYLTKLRMLGYSKVDIVWYDIYFASDFKKLPGDKNRYEAIASIFQKFEGKGNSEISDYSDITKKSIQIIIEQIEVYEGNTKTKRWAVLIGDIMVEETR